MTVQFATDFPGGNGLLMDLQEGPDGVRVRFSAQPKNCPDAMWFHFRLAGLRGRPATVVLANPEQTLGGPDWSSNRIVFRPTGQGWVRSGPAVAVATPGGRTEWAWAAPPGETIEAAHCFPYQPADLDETLARTGEVFQRETIGVSLGDRPIWRLHNRLGEKARPAVMLTARHHAGEVPGAWVLDGLLRHVAEHRRLADALTWWAVPFVDIDDVVAGSYGKDPFPHDCNRGYHPIRRPECGAVAADGRRLKEGSSRMFFVDLHGPGHREHANYVPLRCWDADSQINPVAEAFANLFHAACPEALRSPFAHVTPERSSLSRYPGLASSRWATEILGVEAITLETSYQGNGKVFYSLDDYRRLGAVLAETIAQWMLSPRPAVGA